MQGEHPTSLRVDWQVSYWYGFIAMFTVLPIHQVGSLEARKVLAL